MCIRDRDPVNMAGFMIDNIAKGTLKQWHLEDMDKISKDKMCIRDRFKPFLDGRGRRT